MDFFRITAGEKHTLRTRVFYKCDVRVPQVRATARRRKISTGRPRPKFDIVLYGRATRKIRLPCRVENRTTATTVHAAVAYADIVFMFEMSRQQDRLRPFADGIEISVLVFTRSRSKSCCCGAFAANFECAQGENRVRIKNSMTYAAGVATAC